MNPSHEGAAAPLPALFAGVIDPEGNVILFRVDRTDVIRGIGSSHTQIRFVGGLELDVPVQVEDVIDAINVFLGARGKAIADGDDQ